MTSSCYPFQIILVSFLLFETSAFLPLQCRPFKSTIAVRGSSLSFDGGLSRLNHEDIHSIGHDGDGEGEGIQNLVLELSLIEADEVRRSRLVAIFENEQKKKTWPIFVESFFCALSIAGQAFQTEQNELVQVEDGGADAGRRLWAFVDMTVQSRSVARRMDGTLGSDSVFG
mmetsp:Transcript_11211/g.22155  ORF Transcript_11211/g.22155 Transcript_11211/m.22155 type:complete len:171 (-) Transcript_11211:339-851(-)